jgi:two-component system LytT family sensor kinase
MFSIKYRYAVIVVLAVYSYFNTLFSEVYAYYHINAPAYLIIAVFVLITCFIWEANRLMQKFLLRFFTSNDSIQFLLVFFLTGIILSALITFSIVFVLDRLLLNLPLAVFSIALKLAVTYATRINLFLHIINSVVSFAQKYKKKELETEELKRINTQAHLQAIKNQINPHFLFNNLNVLSSLVMLDSPDANKFIEEFAKVYRHILSSQQHELITLQSEIEFMEPYVFLLKKRFPESLHVSVDIPVRYLSWYLPPVALQMLVENAIKHNIASKTKPLYIKISVDNKEKVVVSNNLQLKIPENESTNFGLRNISQRYHLIAGKNIEIIETNKNFSVLLPLIQPRDENHNN